MAPPRDAATVERARIPVETTTRSLDHIAAEVGVCTRTLRNWIKQYNWRRPPGVARAPKLPPEKRGPAQRVFENRASVGDLALLLGCDTSYVYHVARHRGWGRSEGGAAVEPPPPGDEIAAIVAALRNPATGRGDAVALIERAIALTAADALAAGDARAERRTALLGRLVAHVRNLPEEARAAHKDTDATDTADHFPDANDLIEEIARRVEAAGNEWLDPRILALVAETIA